MTGCRRSDKAEIEAILPHRDPFLLLDEVIELEPGKRVVARKLVRPRSGTAPGTFPGGPIMPGVLIVEAMAQAGAVAVLSRRRTAASSPSSPGSTTSASSGSSSPGDELTLSASSRRVRGPIGRGQGDARRWTASSPRAAR